MLVEGGVAWLVRGLCLPALELPVGRAMSHSSCLFLTHTLKAWKGRAKTKKREAAGERIRKRGRRRIEKSG